MSKTKEIDIRVPSSLAEIPLSKYQRFAKVTGNDQELMARKMVQIFCDVDEVLEISHKDAIEIMGLLSAVLSQKPELVHTFQLNDVTYGFIPNLDEMTYGEFIDLETYISKWEDMHKAMSVLYRPVTKKAGKFYDIEKYQGTIYSDTMKGAPMEVVAGALLFFYRIARELSSHFLTTFKATPSTKTTQPEEGSPESGDGLPRLTRWLVATLQNTTWSLSSLGGASLPS